MVYTSNMAPPNDAALQELLDLVVSHVFTRPLSDFVDVDRVLDAVTVAATPERLARAQERWLIPLRQRMLDRARGSTVTLRQWLPDDVAVTVAEALGEPAPLPRTLVDEMVASERVREGVRAMLQETLTSFVAKATGTGDANEGAGRGGLRGALGWGARAVVASGKGLMAGLGDEIQRQLQDRARDFVDSAVGSVQNRIAERLKSDDTARALGKRRRRWFEGVLAKTESEATRGLHRAPTDRFDQLVPRVIAHNVARAELRSLVRDEMALALQTLSARTMGELLDEAGLRQAVHDGAREIGLPWMKSFVATDGFTAWWKMATESTVERDLVDPPTAA